MNKVILHIDVNSAFLSWEAVYRLNFLGGMVDLREIPSVVGGDQNKRRGVVLAKSTLANKYHIQTGETILEATRKCPDLTIVPPNYGLYETSSKAFMEILREYTPYVEQYSIDEAFIDVTAVVHFYGTGEKLAYFIKDRIQEELGFTVNIGVAENKLLAKMASDFTKPNRVHTLWKEEIPLKMWPLSVRELFYVGRATENKLYTLGIRTIGELAHTERKILQAHLKKQGEVVWNYANGIDETPLQYEPTKNKGYGNSTTLPQDVTDAQMAKHVLLSLVETIARRLRTDRMRAEVISVGIKDYDLQYASHQKTLHNGTNITNELYEYACQAFDELWRGVPIRHLGVQVSKVSEGEGMRQMSFFEKEEAYEKWEEVDATMDQLRNKFGMDIVKRATFLESEIDHMTGGVSRERRSVNYDEEEIL
ncbi:MAG: DNA polymerase IV [Eubacteriales bacterium]